MKKLNISGNGEESGKGKEEEKDDGTQMLAAITVDLKN